MLGEAPGGLVAGHRGPVETLVDVLDPGHLAQMWGEGLHPGIHQPGPFGTVDIGGHPAALRPVGDAQLAVSDPRPSAVSLG